MKIKAAPLLLCCLISNSLHAGVIENPELTGVIRCYPAANYRADYYDMYACKTAEGILSISEFFNKYKRNKGDKIIRVIYDSHQDLFHIYYEQSQIFTQQDRQDY